MKAAAGDDAIERRPVDDQIFKMGNARARHGSTVMLSPSL